MRVPVALHPCEELLLSCLFLCFIVAILKVGPGILFIVHSIFFSVHVGTWPIWSVEKFITGSGFYIVF